MNLKIGEMKLNTKITIETVYNEKTDSHQSKLVCDTDSTVGEVLTSLELAKKAFIEGMVKTAKQNGINDSKILMKTKINDLKL